MEKDLLDGKLISKIYRTLLTLHSLYFVSLQTLRYLEIVSELFFLLFLLDAVRKCDNTLRWNSEY